MGGNPQGADSPLGLQQNRGPLPCTLGLAGNPVSPLPSGPLPQKYGRALVVLPYVSIVNEKSAHLEAVLRPMHASVKGFCGGAEEGAAVQPLAPRCAGLGAPGCIQRLAGRYSSRVVQTPKRRSSVPPACHASASNLGSRVHCAGVRRWPSAPLRRRTWPSTGWRRRGAWVSCEGGEGASHGRIYLRPLCVDAAGRWAAAAQYLLPDSIPPFCLLALQASCAVWWWTSCIWCQTRTEALAWR